MTIIYLISDKTALTPDPEIMTDLEGTDKIRPWAYDTTNTLVWFPPSEYTLKKESGEKPDSIRLLYPDDHPCSMESDTVPRKLSYLEFGIRIARKCTEAIIFRLKLTPFSRTYVDRREKVKPLHLAMSE